MDQLNSSDANNWEVVEWSRSLSPLEEKDKSLQLEDDDDNVSWDVVTSASDGVQSFHSFSDGFPSLSYKDALLKDIGEVIQGPETHRNQTTKTRTCKAQRSLASTPYSSPEETSLDDEKPMAGKHRAKHSHTGRRRGLCGNTGRKQDQSKMKECYTTWLALGPASILLAETLTAIEMQTKQHDYGWVYSNQVNEIYANPLNKRQDWRTIPEILEAESIATPKRTKMRGVHRFRWYTEYRLSNLAAGHPEETLEYRLRGYHKSRWHTMYQLPNLAVGQPEETVEYRLYHPAETGAPDALERDAFCLGRYYAWWRYKDRDKRQQLKKTLRQDVSELIAN